MRISELAEAAGVSVATVKYYLREGLLPRGTATGRNQAAYDEAHLHRLRLVRALRDVAGLDIRTIRRVAEAIDDERLSLHEVFGVAQRALDETDGQGPPSSDVAEARREVDAFLAELGWRIAPDAPARGLLGDALAALRRLGRDARADVFRPYAMVANEMASWEVAAVSGDMPRATAVERLVVGTVIYGAAFEALRRLAHENRSALVAPAAEPTT
ncbi:MAG TPA: MerR family transcriptional regulator [Candidatus Limnocylindrales bacterium]|nr:MerR family transcriptional regulator [Candidatus Limnocylindrales bacterium]